ncbi:MAG: hypothetical protein R3B90_13440 [Planctomycetaceae bacterium]
MLEPDPGFTGRELKARPFISTFHAFCVRVLRQEIEHLGYPLSFSDLIGAIRSRSPGRCCRTSG